MSEPNAGSDVVSMKLRAEKRGDRYVLNGSKTWITNGPDANTYVIYAKTDLDKGPTASPPSSSSATGKASAAATSSTSWACAAPTPASCSSTTWKCRKKTSSASSTAACVLMSGLDYERVVLSGGPTGIMQAAWTWWCPTSTTASSSARASASSS
jgi:isovaleryl-CoA dehydrogenase